MTSAEALVDIALAADLICLVYHEGRNVRHPSRKGLVPDAQKFSSLVQLSTNRDEAWRQLGVVRKKAAACKSVACSADIFAKHFSINLGTLRELYERPIWKHSAYGGNAWGKIAAAIEGLICSSSSGDHAAANVLVREILAMNHNTGSVKAKLARLRAVM